ncbi:hypothetical protein D910_04070 [Dendroctonus ponderosae]|uniref:Regulatory protein zeste n=1 Tax=Dendroctonus ponderosae TaxID=77166 RepID=U4TYE9_DENPD|nr:hypothetical protein D910_04070 [Dendroctonus ponderosae]
MDQGDKKRCTNFSKDEVEILMDLVETHRHVIERKKTDTVTNAAKAAEWRTIATTFNAICGTGRTGKMLRSKWDSLKKSTKKEYAELRSQVYKTGGGPLPDLKLTGLGKRVLNLVGVSAKGTECEFDSDAAFVTPSELESLEIVTDVDGCSAEVVEIPVADSAEIKWDTWSPALLRQSKHPALNLPSNHSAEIVDESLTTVTPSEYLQCYYTK